MLGHLLHAPTLRYDPPSVRYCSLRGLIKYRPLEATADTHNEEGQCLVLEGIRDLTQVYHEELGPRVSRQGEKS